MESRRTADEPAPRGRDQVRIAVRRAARELFAARGPSVTMREIAARAGVNLGLVHKYVGNKDDVLRAVLALDDERSATVIGDAESAGDAVRRMFLVGVADPEYVRIVAWLVLTGRSDLLPEGNTVNMRALADRSGDAGDPERRARMMAALGAVAGWSLFGERILDAAGVGLDDADEHQRRIGDLLAEWIGE